jgi:antagonist of SinR
MAGLPGIRNVSWGGRVLAEQSVKIEGIDVEWLQLIMEAKNLGLEKEEIRKFLHNNGAKAVLIKA